MNTYKTIVSLLMGTMLLVLGSCGNKSQSWTLEEVAGVLDLSQLGERTYDKQGQMYLGGKLVPQEVLKQIKKPYGRTGNYLGLSEQAKASLSSELYTAAMDTPVGELVAYLKKNGIRIADIEAARDARGELQVSGLHKLTKLSQQRVGKTLLNQMVAQSLVQSSQQINQERNKPILEEKP
jgi:hypothetical protein